MKHTIISTVVIIFLVLSFISAPTPTPTLKDFWNGSVAEAQTSSFNYCYTTIENWFFAMRQRIIFEGQNDWSLCNDILDEIKRHGIPQTNWQCYNIDNTHMAADWNDIPQNGHLIDDIPHGVANKRGWSENIIGMCG